MNRSSHVDLSYYVPNGEWQLLGTPELIRVERFYPEFNASFVELTIPLNIRRKTLYYM
jgi:hypothetical protein